jgi:hypothetical protein
VLVFFLPEVLFNDICCYLSWLLAAYSHLDGFYRSVARQKLVIYSLNTTEMKTKTHGWSSLSGRNSIEQSELMLQINGGAFCHGFLNKISVIFIIREGGITQNCSTHTVRWREVH